MVGALELGSIAYRAIYHVWPGQGASSRISWCGRDYDDYGSPAQSLRQITGSNPGYRLAGEFREPLGLSSRQVVSSGCSPYAPGVVFVSIGSDRYDAFGLSGGP